MESKVTLDCRESPWQTAFIISAAFNLCVILYFSLFAAVNLAVTKFTDNESRAAIAHKKIPNFMHCFYFNLVIYPCLVVEAFFVVFTTFPRGAAFQGDLPFSVVGFFSAVFGVRLFLFGRDALILKNAWTKVIVLFLHGVYLLVVGNAILTESAAIMAIIAITSEGDLFVMNIGRLLKQLGYRRSTCYRATMFLGCYTAIIFRAMSPLALLGFSLVEGKPFRMTPNSLVVFFLALVVYGVVNTWHVNSSIARICKKKDRMIEVPYANFVQSVDDTLKEGVDEIPPTYQDACEQPAGDLAVVEPETSDQTANGATGIRSREQLTNQLQEFADDNRGVDMPAIFLRSREEPYHCGNGAISYA